MDRNCTSCHKLDNLNVIHTENTNKGDGFQDHTDLFKVTNFKTSKSAKELIQIITEELYSNTAYFEGPFGIRKCVYMDHTASGQPLRCIEEFLLKNVLPFYGNTHTTSTETASRCTNYRHEARRSIKTSVGGNNDDVVIFCGSGSTSAVHKLVYHLAGSSKRPKPIVFIGSFEHHSNILPWREAGALVVIIPETKSGAFDLEALGNQLQEAVKDRKNSGRLLIGSFSVASNVTGVVTDDVEVTVMMHKYGGLALWDYSAAASHVAIVMNAHLGTKCEANACKDAIFFSGHKLLGGPQTPGVLVAKKHIFAHRNVPHGVGGGTVLAVTHTSAIYTDVIEEREEGGTPAIIESIRLGLVFSLKDAIGSDYIISQEALFTRLALERWSKIPEIKLLGPIDAVRTPVISFVIQHPETGYYLHYDFVVVLLNDLFGIQARGGCACAGPYGQDLLGISTKLAQQYEDMLRKDGENEGNPPLIMRPGFVRISFAFHSSLEEVNFAVEAVELVAKYGWKLLPLYKIDPTTNEFKFIGQTRKISTHSYNSQKVENVGADDENKSINFASVLRDARGVVKDSENLVMELSIKIITATPPKRSPLRWFLLPVEAQALLLENDINSYSTTKIPFTPQSYCPSVEARTKQNQLLYSHLSVPYQLKCARGPENINGIQQYTMIDTSEDSLGFSQKTMSDYSDSSIMLIESTLKEKSLLNCNDRVLIALSGGPCSMSLFNRLRQLQSEMKRDCGKCFTISAYTLDPSDSSKDLKYLVRHIQALDVSYFYETYRPTRKNHMEASMCNRQVVSRALKCAEVYGFNVVAFGHSNSVGTQCRIGRKL